MKTVIALLLLSSSIFAELPRFNNKRLIVKLKEGQSLEKNHLIKKADHLFGQLYVLHTNDALQLESNLLKSKKFEYIEKDFYSKRSLATPSARHESVPRARAKYFNDKFANKLWGFDERTSHGMSVNMAYSTHTATQNEEIIVAVVDTGVDVKHEDLKANIWINEGEIAGNKIDDDGNGYVDDINGINTLVRDAQGKATVDLKDGHGHGTHVSGTIAAVQNNKIGIAGVSSHTKIMGIRTVPNDADELDVDIIEGFLYAAKHGARLINCSFGKKVNEGGMAVSDTIKHIGENYNVLVVAAAGNETSNIDVNLKYPASFQNDSLLVVASTSSLGGLSYFSNYGAKNVDLAAPGSNIYSTMPGNKYGDMSGTSMATPNTVGVAAEVLSRYPDLSAIELKETLMNSVTPVKAFNGKMISGGRVDLHSALSSL
jgi:thermitase